MKTPDQYLREVRLKDYHPSWAMLRQAYKDGLSACGVVMTETTGWRELVIGDTLLEGDEYKFRRNKRWLPVGRTMLGRPIVARTWRIAEYRRPSAVMEDLH